MNTRTWAEEIDGARLVRTHRQNADWSVVYVWKGGDEIDVWEVHAGYAQAIVTLRTQPTVEQAQAVIEQDIERIYRTPAQGYVPTNTARA